MPGASIAADLCDFAEQAACPQHRIAPSAVVHCDADRSPVGRRKRGNHAIQQSGPDLRHIANAHTDGDTYVWFKTANVLATGDTFTNGRYPNIDFANGGNINGMIAAADVYLKLTNAKSRIVPGHGPVADKAALTEYRTMLVTARDRMAQLVKDGKSEDDVIAAKPFADLDKKWAPTELASTNWIRVVYHSLKAEPEKKPFLNRILRRS